MYQKLFQITLVLFLVVVSIIVVALVVTALLNAFSSQMLARDHGIAFAVGGGDFRWFGYMIIAGSLLIAGFYLFIRRRRFRR